MRTSNDTPADGSAPASIVALSGGVGAARFLSGLVQETGSDPVVAVVNTGDDREFYGVHVSPDIDIVTYTLAGVVDRKLGYGLARDTFSLMERLAELGHESWFRLGDRDFANCLHRTLRLREGDGLAKVAEQIRRAYGVQAHVLPMSQEPCPTLVELTDGRKIHFEEYLVRERAPDQVRSVDLSAAGRATPAPGVIEAIRAAAVILVCPSNPVVSIGPILAIPGIRDALRTSAAPVVAVSPIVGGSPIKGPASQLLRGIGAEVSALGVARLYRDFISGFVFDECDAELESAIGELGLATRTTDSIMRDRAGAARLARCALELARDLR